MDAESTPWRNSEACEPVTDSTARWGTGARLGVVRRRDRRTEGSGMTETRSVFRLAPLCLLLILPLQQLLLADLQSDMSSSCRTLIEAFHDCVMNSPCVKRDGRLPSECLRSELQELPEECQSLRKATYDCKRGMVRDTILLHCTLLLGAHSCLARHAETIPG
jgi:hypothetical protein